MVIHPFESFEAVDDFISQAANDPAVLAIKMTLYRVSGDSQIVRSLAHAAENGKKVTVVLELKARFDEERNIAWAKKLEKAGCHVVYGLVGLKIHAKMTLIVRQERDLLRRYVHISTGNYNGKSAKIYTDIGLFTSSPEIGDDIAGLFNEITGLSAPQAASYRLCRSEAFKKYRERLHRTGNSTCRIGQTGKDHRQVERVIRS
jgi:polyphosphate kinase